MKNFEMTTVKVENGELRVMETIEKLFKEYGIEKSIEGKKLKPFNESYYNKNHFSLKRRTSKSGRKDDMAPNFQMSQFVPKAFEEVKKNPEGYKLDESIIEAMIISLGDQEKDQNDILNGIQIGIISQKINAVTREAIPQAERIFIYGLVDEKEETKTEAKYDTEKAFKAFSINA